MRKALLIVILLVLSSADASWGLAEEAELSFFAMDTRLVVRASGGNAGEVLELARERVEQLERLWSVTDEASEIYAANQAGGRSVSVSDDTAAAISFALEMAESTLGALDPTIYPVLAAWGFTTDENRIPPPSELEVLLESVDYRHVSLNSGQLLLPEGMRLDLGAIGKGYAGDEVVKLLKVGGVTSALLDFGGNIQTIGSRPDGSDWRLGLRNPFAEGNVGVLRVSDMAVVTSGAYERYFVGEDGRRYGHILDTKTGRPAENGLASVTVIAPEGKLCDALSTAFYAMGKEKAEAYWRAHPGFDMILVAENGEIWLTEGVRDRFSVRDDYRNADVHVIEYEEG